MFKQIIENIAIFCRGAILKHYPFHPFKKGHVMFIGSKMLALRKAKRMSLTELSQTSGVQLATLSRIENMKMVGTLESHIQIAKALGVDVTELYKDITRESAI